MDLSHETFYLHTFISKHLIYGKQMCPRSFIHCVQFTFFVHSIFPFFVLAYYGGTSLSKSFFLPLARYAKFNKVNGTKRNDSLKRIRTVDVGGKWNFSLRMHKGTYIFICFLPSPLVSEFFSAYLTNRLLYLA